MSYNNIFSSIINNKNNINKHRDDISSLNIKVDNIAQGLIIKDEFKLIKYTGYTDWRLKIQIYSNIHDVDSQVIRPDLLINNNYELIYTDYIHLLNNNELRINIIEEDWNSSQTISGRFIQEINDVISFIRPFKNPLTNAYNTQAVTIISK